MGRHFLRGAALLLGVVSVWWGGVLLLNATVFSAERYLTDYLEALESGDRESAAALAGWANEALPVGAENISQPLVTGVRRLDSSSLEVQATFELAGKSASSVFTLTQQPALLGVFDQWAFETPPVAVIELERTWIGPVLIGGVPVSSTGRVEVLVPGTYNVESGTAWVNYVPSSIETRQPEETHSLEAQALPSKALQNALDEAVSKYLDECASQEVLQPSSCPFGITLVDRVVGSPQWSISQMPRITSGPDDAGGRWIVVGEGGVATFSADVQSLFDGRIERLSEPQEFGVTGTVTGLETDAPQLRVD